jgi:hypothetical protein
MQCPWCCWRCPGGFGCVTLVSCLWNARKRRRGQREVDVPNRAEFAKEIEELFWGDVEAGNSQRIAGRNRRGALTSGSLRRELCMRKTSQRRSCVGRSQPCGRARNAQLRRGADVPIDFRCYVLPTATHTLATVRRWRRASGCAVRRGREGAWAYRGDAVVEERVAPAARTRFSHVEGRRN